MSTICGSRLQCLQDQISSKTLTEWHHLKALSNIESCQHLKLYKIGVKLDMVNKDPDKLVPTDNVKHLNQEKVH